MANPSRYTQLVTLAIGPTETDDSDGYYAPLVPPTAWVGIEPLVPSNEDRTLQSYVRMRYRPDVTQDVRLSFYDAVLLKTRHLLVRSIQPPAGRGDEAILLCEEPTA